MDPSEAFNLELRIYKNHDLLSIPEIDVEALWRDAEPWTTVKGIPQRRDSLAAKYPGHTAWVLAPPPELFALGITPCDGTVVVSLCRCPSSGESPQGRGQLRSYNYRHATSELKDFAGLPETVWHQLGGPGDDVLCLLHLMKNPRYTLELCQDERTGKPYPYVLFRVIILIKK